MRYQELRDDYKDTEAIGIPHHVAYQLGSRGKNWATHDENFSPFAEIYSSHGCSENDTGGMDMERHLHMGQEPVKPAMKEVWRLVFMLDVLHPVTTIMFLQHVTMEPDVRACRGCFQSGNLGRHESKTCIWCEQKQNGD